MFDFIPISNDLFVTAFGIYFRFCLISFFALFGLFIAVKYSNEIDKILTRFKHIRSLRAHNIITFKYQFGLLVLSSLFFFSFVRFSIFRCIQKITFNHYKNKTNEFFHSSNEFEDTQVHCNGCDTCYMRWPICVSVCIFRVSIFTLHLTSSAVAKTFQESDFHFPMPFSVWCLSQCVVYSRRRCERVQPIQFALTQSELAYMYYKSVILFYLFLFVNARRMPNVKRALFTVHVDVWFLGLNFHVPYGIFFVEICKQLASLICRHSPPKWQTILSVFTAHSFEPPQNNQIAKSKTRTYVLSTHRIDLSCQCSVFLAHLTHKTCVLPQLFNINQTVVFFSFLKIKCFIEYIIS